MAPYSPTILWALGTIFLATTSALAQVTVNPRALDPLGGPHSTPPEHSSPARPTPSLHAASHPAPARPASAHLTPAHTAPSHSSPPAVPPAAPPVAVLQPLLPSPPAHPTTPPPPAPVVGDAVGTVSQIPAGIRVTFASATADLNQATNDALRGIARASPTGIFNVTAYAAGLPDDPSTPRRLSLSRALAARSLLIAEGVSSTRIYVRAAGPNVADGPPDRVDVTVSTPTNRAGHHSPRNSIAAGGFAAARAAWSVIRGATQAVKSVVSKYQTKSDATRNVCRGLLRQASVLESTR